MTDLPDTMVDGRTVGELYPQSRSAEESSSYGHTSLRNDVNIEGAPEMATSKTVPLDGSLIARKGTAAPA
jgi:hypothetical protein